MIFSVTSEIDDEAEPPPPRIFVACHQKAAFFTTADMASADLRHDLRHAGAMIGQDCRHNDVVRRMALIERPAILNPALTLGKRATADFLPDVGPGIADGLFCHRPLVGGEQVRKTDRDDRPFAVLFIPRRVLPQQRMDLGIALCLQMEAAMP